MCHWFYLALNAMGSPLEITLHKADCPHSARTVEQELCSAMENLENRISRWRPGWVKNLNDSAGKSSVVLQQQDWNILLDLCRYSALSGGAFDIMLGHIVDLWGFSPTNKSSSDFPSSDELKLAMGKAGMALLKLDPRDHSAFITDPLARLDLGGVGKGLALQEIKSRLHSFGITRGLINFGGSSVMALGTPLGRKGWEVGMALAPGRPVHRIISIRDQCITTSGTTLNFRKQKGRRASHIINPRSGVPVRAVQTVSVFSICPVMGEIISTAWPFMNENRRSNILEIFPDLKVIESRSTARGIKNTFFPENSSYTEIDNQQRMLDIRNFKLTS